MPAIGAPITFEDKFRFTVEIDGIVRAGFNKCSELSAEVEIISYREGGRLTPYKSPGLADVSDITLERGAVASDSDMYEWFEQVVDLVSQTGEVNTTFRRNFDIVVRDRDNSVLKRWRVVGAWPSKFVAGDWDNDTSEHTVEMVTLACDSFERIL